MSGRNLGWAEPSTDKPGKPSTHSPEPKRPNTQECPHCHRTFENRTHDGKCPKCGKAI